MFRVHTQVQQAQAQDVTQPCNKAHEEFRKALSYAFKKNFKDHRTLKFFFEGTVQYIFNFPCTALL